MLREWHVVLVHVHGDVELAAGALREAEVVEVPVREDERLHVGRPAPELREGLGQRGP
jgi:hypothetical protein